MAKNQHVNKVEFGGQTLMDLTGDTATPADVAHGKTFHLASGAQAEGTATSPSPSDDDPLMDGTKSPGESNDYARGDHVHPTDTSRAPTSHASTGTTYGKGTASNYGHLKLSASTSSTSGESDGVAATPSAVKAACDLANGKQDAVSGYSSADIATLLGLVSTANATTNGGVAPGGFGLGGTATAIPSTANLNSYTSCGYYYWESTPTNAPNINSSVMIVIGGGNNRVAQIALRTVSPSSNTGTTMATPNIYFRVRTPAGVWTSWYSIAGTIVS